MGYYRIIVLGHVAPEWSPSLGLSINLRVDGTSHLNGQLPDEAALLGCLQRLSALGATILSVDRMTEEEIEMMEVEDDGSDEPE